MPNSRTPNGDVNLFNHTAVVADALAKVTILGAIFGGMDHLLMRGLLPMVGLFLVKVMMTLDLVSPTWGILGEGNEEITRYIMCCRNIGGSSLLATATTVEATAKLTTPQPFKNPTNSPIPEDIDGYELEDIGYKHDAETSWGCIFLASCRLVV